MVTAVIGGQYGSEGKGLIVAHIADRFGVHVRVGAANAGHSFHTADGKRVVQQLPCAAYAHPQATVALGPGALISPDILIREIEENRRWRAAADLPALDLRIDPRAHVITGEHIAAEVATDLADRIGSTSATAREGIGAAQASRVMREETCVQAAAWDALPDAAKLEDLPRWLPRHLDRGVLLEGTQGAGLSLTTGQFPYVTSRDTSAATLAADCGLGPRLLDEIILVCRTYPIRVAGNSGPFWHDSRELTWDELGAPAEHTTVTKLERRVATFSLDQVDYAARLNSATRIALTFCDYIDPKIAGMASKHQDISSQWIHDDLRRRSARCHEFVRAVELRTGLPVSMLGTGPGSVVEHESDMEPRRRQQLEATMLRLRVPSRERTPQEREELHQSARLPAWV